MNLIGTCATNRVTGSTEPENEARRTSLDRPVRCLQYRRRQLSAAAAQPAGPPAGYKIERGIHREIAGRRDQRSSNTRTRTTGQWQFWVRRQGAFTQLDPEPAGYPADFIFTNDLKWIVREQKIGSGTSTLHLYRLTPQGYVRASKKPLGDLAWDYLKSRPDWRKLVKAPEYHNSAYLLEGIEENYRELGVDWPANRYLLITLSADADVKGTQAHADRRGERLALQI